MHEYRNINTRPQTARCTQSKESSLSSKCRHARIVIIEFAESRLKTLHKNLAFSSDLCL